MREGGLDNLSFRLQASGSPPAVYLLTLIDKDSVIVSPVITVHALRRKGELETM